MNIILVGLMGSGKSAVGRLLAAELGRAFVDTDLCIAEQAGCTIPTIFAAEGEAGFRRREAEVIAAVTAETAQVIATGGGAVLAPANRDALRRSGLLFWLDAPPEELYRRVKEQGLQGRPLLAGEDPLQRLVALAHSRREAYALAAHYRVETAGRSASEVARAIIDLLGARA